VLADPTTAGFTATLPTGAAASTQVDVRRLAVVEPTPSVSPEVDRTPSTGLPPLSRSFSITRPAARTGPGGGSLRLW
jgi:hypothetical protein